MSESDNVHDLVRRAITLARAEQIASVRRLRKRLVDLGHSKDVVDAALELWKKEMDNV